MDEIISKECKKGKQRVDIGIQALVYDKYSIQCEVSVCTVWLISVVFGIISMFIGTYFYLFVYGPRYHVDEELLHNIGHHGVLTFRQYDRNGDGFLSLHEFEPLAHKFNNASDVMEYSDAIEDGDEVFTVESFIHPLKLETMSKDNDSLYSKSIDSLIGLKSWRLPAKPWQNFGAGHLKPFLPPAPSSEYTHEPYHLIYDMKLQGATLSSNRYFPPSLFTDGEVIVHRLLSMFHPRPFIYSRFAPQGGIACVRAYNKKYLDIVFRIHAEFQLNEPPIHPFWFTPAQFTGHVIMDRSASKVLHFNMFVPTEKRLNVDMEWINGPLESDMEVDIGYMNKMELKSTGPSLHMYQAGKNIKDEFLSSDESQYKNLMENIKWDNEISYHEAARILEIHLYPFKQALKEDSTQPELSALAKSYLKNYQFPVMMMVSLPDGTIVSSINANTFMDKEHEEGSVFTSGFEDPSTMAYHKYLEEGLAEAKKLMT